MGVISESWISGTASIGPRTIDGRSSPFFFGSPFPSPSPLLEPRGSSPLFFVGSPFLEKVTMVR
jgi:hypothetical protein